MSLPVTARGNRHERPERSLRQGRAHYHTKLSKELSFGVSERAHVIARRAASPPKQSPPRNATPALHGDCFVAALLAMNKWDATP